MSTSAITRREVSFYTVTKKKKNKNIKDDSLRIKFTTLPKAREFAWELYKVNNFKSLVNSNGVNLSI